MATSLEGTPGRTEAAARTSPLWSAPPLLILAASFFYPLSLIAAQAFTARDGSLSLAMARAVLASGRFQDAFVRTIVIAAAATAGCLAVGFVMALVVAFFPFRGSALVARLIDTFIALPTFLVALALTFLYGSAGLLNEFLMAAMKLSLPPIDFLYSAWGVILAEVTVYTPFVMRPLLAAFSLVETAQIEIAASLGAGFFRIVRQIILPAALPALLAGGSLCLLLTVNEFGIVLFIGAKGVTTLPLLVYDKAIQEFDYTTACVIALVNIVLSIALYFCYRGALGRLGGSGARLV